MNLLSLITTIVVAVASASMDEKPFEKDKEGKLCKASGFNGVWRYLAPYGTPYMVIFAIDERVTEAGDQIGQVSIHAEGMNGNATAPFTDPLDNGFGAIYAEDFTINDDGECSFALGDDFTCPFVDGGATGSCGYSVAAVAGGPNTLVLDFGVVRFAARS